MTVKEVFEKLSACRSRAPRADGVEAVLHARRDSHAVELSAAEAGFAAEHRRQVVGNGGVRR